LLTWITMDIVAFGWSYVKVVVPHQLRRDERATRTPIDCRLCR
jgi:hypothetical protein